MAAGNSGERFDDCRADAGLATFNAVVARQKSWRQTLPLPDILMQVNRKIFSGKEFASRINTWITLPSLQKVACSVTPELNEKRWGLAMEPLPPVPPVPVQAVGDTNPKSTKLLEVDRSCKVEATVDSSTQPLPV